MAPTAGRPGNAFFKSSPTNDRDASLLQVVFVVEPASSADRDRTNLVVDGRDTKDLTVG